MTEKPIKYNYVEKPIKYNYVELFSYSKHLTHHTTPDQEVDNHRHHGIPGVPGQVPYQLPLQSAGSSGHRNIFVEKNEFGLSDPLNHFSYFKISILDPVIPKTRYPGAGLG